MSRVLPILFNTDMVRAILDGKKTVTRRLIKPQPKFRLCYTFAGCNHGTWSYPSDTAHEFWGEEYRLPDCITDEDKKMVWKPPYNADDILYVRESVFQGVGHYLDVSGETVRVLTNDFEYYADGLHEKDHWKDKHELTWMYRRPSIHMPKEAARIWLNVKDVRVERLQDITEEQTENEGFLFTPPCLHQVSEDSYCDLDGPCTSNMKYCDMSAGELFGKVLWDSTIKKSDIDRYGWDASPWVWVIEFERCEKPEGWCV